MRKKTTIISTLIIMTIALSLIGVGFALENNTENKIIDAVTLTKDYIAFDAPESVAVSDNFAAVYDNGRIRIFDKDYLEIGRIETEAYSVFLTGSYLYVTTRSDDGEIFEYDLSGGDVNNITGEKIAGGIYQSFSDGNAVYYVDDSNNLFKYTYEDKSTSLNISKSLIIGALLTASDGVVYSYKGTQVKIADNENGKPLASIDTESATVSSFSVVNNNVLYLTKDKKSLKKGNTVISAENGSSINYCLNGDKIYTADYKKKSLTVYDDNLKAVRNFASFGNESGRLNSPSDAATDEKNVIIADKGNQRVSIYNIASDSYINVSVEHGIDKVGAYSNGFIVYADNKIYVYSNAHNGYILSDTVSSGELLDVAIWNDHILGLMLNGDVKDFTANTVLATLHGSIKMSVNHNTNILYIASMNTVSRINLLTGDEKKYPHTESSFNDFVVDYSGKIYFSVGNVIKSYIQNNGLTAGDKYYINGVSENISVSLHNSGDIYVTDKELHKLLLISGGDIGATSDNSFVAPSEDQWNVIKGIILDASTGLYTSPGNEETLVSATDGSRFLALSEIENCGNKYYYGYNEYNGKYYYVLKGSGIELGKTEFDENTSEYNSLLASGVTVYKFPYSDSAVKTRLSFNVRLKLIDNVADTEEDWGWYKIRYTLDGVAQIGYVINNSIAKITSLQPEPETVFYKVNAGALGNTVNVYESDSEDSPVVYTVNDGDSVLVIGGFDSSSKFTKIYYNNSYGYIATSVLMKDGLTTVQLTAIIVVTICGVALLVTIPLFILLYKKRDKKPDVKSDNIH